MMNVYEMKEAFVKNELESLVCKIDSSIWKLEYEWTKGEEFVTAYDKTERELFKVCVTADSLIALTRDVLKGL